MIEKIDFKKKLNHLYGPSQKVITVVDVPQMTFLRLDGKGDPNSQRFQDAVETLFAASYTLKFIVKKGPAAIDFTVMPLEGLWWAEDMSQFTKQNRDSGFGRP